MRNATTTSVTASVWIDDLHLRQDHAEPTEAGDSGSIDFGPYEGPVT